VTVAGNYAYVTDAEGGGMHVIDIADPNHPEPVASFKGRGDAHCVAVSGRYAYLADDTEGVIVLDVTDPGNLRRIGGYSLGGWAYYVEVLGSHLYMTGPTGLQVLNLSDPASPRPLGACDDWICGLTSYGEYVYGFDTAGLCVLDLSDPTKPRRVGGNTAIAGRTVVGSMNKLFVAAGSDGLIVADLFALTPEPFVERQSLGFHVRLATFPPPWVTNYVVREHPPFGNPRNIK